MIMLPPDTSHKILPLDFGPGKKLHFPRYLSVTMSVSSKSVGKPGIRVKDLSDNVSRPLPSYINIDEHIIKGDPQLRVLEAIKCIYCGSNAYKDGCGTLTDEHVIPKGLGGNIVIGTASCYDCQTSINHYEGRLQKVMLWSVRNKLNLRNEKRRSEKPLSIITAIIDGRLTETEIAMEINPSFLVLPQFGFPKFISDNPEESGLSGLYINSFANLGNLESQDFIAFRTPEVDSQAFCQLLAKIGHSYASSKYGIQWSADNQRCYIGSFQSTLRGIVTSKLTRSDNRLDFYDLIGQTAGSFSSSQALHQVGSNVVDYKNRLYLVVYIRLFAYLESPIYIVIVGVI